MEIGPGEAKKKPATRRGARAELDDPGEEQYIRELQEYYRQNTAIENTP